MINPEVNNEQTGKHPPIERCSTAAGKRSRCPGYRHLVRFLTLEGEDAP